VKDATRRHVRLLREVSFNPRAREGRDKRAKPRRTVRRHVSIHAPVKDATPKPAARRSTRSFNPRAREGRDREVARRCGMDPVSIHAPVKDATLGGMESISSIAFQSTRP